MTRRLAWCLLLLVLAGVTVTWFYRTDLQRAYRDYRQTHTGDEWHGGAVFRAVPRATPYDLWLDEARRRLPFFEGLVIPDIGTVRLGPWPEIGDNITGLYLRFADYQLLDGRILELPAGGRTTPQRHLFEMGVYFLGGPGHTLFFPEGRVPQRVDWQAGSLLAVPLNTRYQHFSDSGAPVRILSVSSFPFALNAADSPAFVFDNDFDFANRYAGEADYFRRAEPLTARRRRQNFIADVLAVELKGGSGRGDGHRTMSWPMARNTVIDMHVTSQLPRSYMKAHRHSSDAFLLILSGEGYSLIWQGEEIEKRQRIDWRKNTLLVPPSYWYHQHFNAGNAESRHLAINTPILVWNLGLRFYDQIERDPPEIRDEWAREMSARLRGGD